MIKGQNFESQLMAMYLYMFNIWYMVEAIEWVLSMLPYEQYHKFIL